MKAEIIAVGSEMLTPFRVDTNSLFLTGELNRLGIEVVRKVIVGDDAEHLQEAFRQALARAELVITIGGLGPTADDLTRETAAEVLGRALKLDEKILQEIQERFRKFGRAMPEINVRQALVPEGAAALENRRGTAPGLWMESQGQIVILLPGPPSELKPMYAEQVEPRLAARPTGIRLVTRELRVAGLPESDVEQRIAPIYSSYPSVQTTILAAPGEIQVHPRAWTADVAKAERMLDEVVERMALALGDSLFTTEGESLEQVVANQLTSVSATLAVAESCTGGLVAERLTSLPGSSTYFLGGVVCYANTLKSAWLDVPAELIAAKGAVSAEVARALAEGVRRQSGAALGLSVTGIAGPGGGSPEKPVGTVHIAMADAAGARERSYRFPGDRERIRFQASQMALDMVRRHLMQSHRANTATARREKA